MKGLFCGRRGGIRYNDGGKVRLIRYPTTTEILATDKRRKRLSGGKISFAGLWPSFGA